MNNYIQEIEFDKKFNMYARFENGHKFHKIKILNAPNFCGMYFKVFKRTITNYNNIYDFMMILEKLLNAPIGNETREKIKKQLEILEYNVITHNNKPLF